MAARQDGTGQAARRRRLNPDVAVFVATLGLSALLWLAGA